MHPRCAFSGFVASFVFIFTMTGCSSMRLSDGTQKQIKTYNQERKIATEDDVVSAMKAWVVDSSPNVEGGFFTKADHIERVGLTKSKTIDQPWSGTYWPDRVGGVAAHYRIIDQNMSRLLAKPEKNYKRFVRRHNRYWSDYANLTEKEIGVLSPAEKYDLLVGDKEFTFTRRIWDGINQQYKAYGNLAMWSGICNGWTSASIELNRPRRTVYAKNPDGKIIPFYPDDLKALASVLWAHNRITDSTKMADGTPAMVNYGMRCNQQKPLVKKGKLVKLKEGEYATDPNECRDLNPGVWHLAIVNRIGAQGKAFVMDKNYNKVVNNHVVYAYNYTYYNPRTGKEGKLENVKLDKDAYKKDDAFRKSRNDRARWIVGVEMKVKYMDSDLTINGKSTDDEEDDKVSTMKLKYDLELAEDNTIVGGQWRINTKQRETIIGYAFQKPRFPDFIWYARLWTYADAEDANDPYLDGHDWANEPIPQILRERAVAAAKAEWNFGTLADRVYDSPVKQSLRDQAAQFSQQYDAEFANGNQPTPERIAELNKQLNEWHAKLDEKGVPRGKPYAQPLGRIVYGLFAAAKEKDPNPKPAATINDTETEEDN